jgi:hypothetical protein
MLSDLLLVVLLGPLGLVMVIFRHLGRGKKIINPKEDKEWYLNIVLSKEDAVSQLFLLLSFCFLGVTLLIFNRNLGDLLAWRTVVLITCLAGLGGAYYLKTIYVLLFSLAGLAGWWSAQASQWIEGKDIKTSAIFAGLSLLALLFYTLGHLHEREIRFKRFALVYSALGTLAVLAALFFLSTMPGLAVLEEMTRGGSFFGSWQLTLSLVVFLAALAGATIYGAAQKLISEFELLAVFALAALFGMLALLPEQTMFVQSVRPFYYGGGELAGDGVLWALVFNGAVFFVLLGVIFSGYLRRETWLINLGLLFLFLLIIAKYFDWFFTFLDKSVFFIGAGVLLFVIGWLMEKSRRYMITTIKSQTP